MSRRVERELAKRFGVSVQVASYLGLLEGRRLAQAAGDPERYLRYDRNRRRAWQHLSVADRRRAAEIVRMQIIQAAAERFEERLAVWPLGNGGPP